MIEHIEHVMPVSVNFTNKGKIKTKVIGEYGMPTKINTGLPYTKVNITQSNNNTPANILYDYDYTDEDGIGTFFLEEGEYYIKAWHRGALITQPFTVENGISIYYEKPIDCFIKKRYDDVIELHNYDKLLITGMLVNSYESSTYGDVIISQQDKLIAYANSPYQFLIKPGIYDIRIRRKNASIQIYKNFNFLKGNGFFNQLNYKDSYMSNQILINSEADKLWRAH